MAYDPNHAPYNSKKDTARSLVYYAIKTGKLKKQNCSVCGSPNAEADHSNYSQPTKVTWLCRKHHAKKRLGKKLKKAIASTRK